MSVNLMLGVDAFDTFMKMRDGISEYKGAILVDEEMPNVIAKQASDIRVWDIRLISYQKIKLEKDI